MKINEIKKCFSSILDVTPMNCGTPAKITQYFLLMFDQHNKVTRIYFGIVQYAKQQISNSIGQKNSLLNSALKCFYVQIHTYKLELTMVQRISISYTQEIFNFNNILG